MNKSQLNRVSEVVWEIPKEIRNDLRVPARVYAQEHMLDAMLSDKSLEQLINVATLPGIQKAALVMPDAHEGYGFPIGGVAATRYPDGVISPGGIGYDINCGVRLLITEHEYNDVIDKLEPLSKVLYKMVPSGVGKGGLLKLTAPEMNDVLVNGAGWAINNGYGFSEDLEHMESHGCLPDADPEKVSDHAKQRGHDQLGTIGSGNHFVEVQRVGKLYDEVTASAFGLHKDQVVILIHTGSRGLGHQVATDYLRVMMKAMPNYNIKIPDRELACVPFNSAEGQDYFKAMTCAANFAWCNRQIITYEIRDTWKQVFGEHSGKLKLLYDVAHNIAKIEDHIIDGKTTKVIVHRKGATRAFGPHFAEIPDAYKSYGQPVLIPGSMGTSSYVLAGTDASMQNSFGSTCHGAGRAMSRRKARKEIHGRELQDELRGRGIYVKAGSSRGVAEEAPQAYKDVDDVVETVHLAGIARKVAQLKPLAVVKG